MKRPVFSVLVVVLVAAVTQVAMPTQERLQNIYQSILRASRTHTPETYSVRIKNGSLEDSLKELPEDILTGTGDPQVILQFRKGEGVSMYIENVKEEYAHLFSMYEEYLQSSGISKVQNPPEFKSIMEKDRVAFQSEKADSVILKVWDPKGEIEEGNYALFTLDKGRWVIRQVVYYLEDEPIIRLENDYRSYGSYYMPEQIVMTNLRDSSTEIFRFENYKFGK